MLKLRMKILFLITKSNFGGAQKYVYELAVAATNDGNNVTVACGGTGEAGATTGDLVKRLETEGIPTLYIQHFMRNISLRREIAAFLEIYTLLRNERPDVLHISSSKAGGIGAAAARVAGIKNIVFTVHGLPTDETWRPHWQRQLIKAFTWITVLLSHHTIVLSKETKDRLTKQLFIKKKIHLIHNGVAETDTLARDTARTALHIPIDARCIGGVGELHPNKNWFLAISALAALPDNTYLCIIGEGEERNSLERHASKIGVADRVFFAGYMTDAATYLSAFDILVLPSKKEGLPYVILEAGMARLPVVATDLPGLQEIITTGENGLLVAPTVTNLTASLTMLLRDDGMRNRLGGALYSRVKATFSVTDMYTKTFLLYSSTNKSTGRTAA